MSRKIHVTPDGPALCKATVKDCPYAGAGHFETAKEAEEVFSEKMREAGYCSSNKASKKLALETQRASEAVEAIRSSLLELVASTSLKELSLANLSQVGAAIEDEVFTRLGLPADAAEFTLEELARIGAMNSKVLSEVQGEIELNSKVISGPFAKTLREALTSLPSGAVNLVVNPIYTKRIRLDSQTRDGYHVAQAEVAEPITAEIISHFFTPTAAVKDDFIIADYSPTRTEIEKNVYDGFAVAKVVKPLGAPVQAGQNVLSSVKALPNSQARFIALMQAEVLDHEGVIEPGKEKELARLAPEITESMTNQAIVTKLYAGVKPTGSLAKGKTYTKIADSFEVKNMKGESYTVTKPLYEIKEKKLSYSAHTIASKDYGAGSTGLKSVLAHEFGHALQSTIPGGIPGEKEIFQKLSASKTPQKGDGYNYYEGFPDKYMGDTGGREVFTRATEGVFFPKADSYLYSGNENQEKVRRWALGAWAAISLVKTKK